MCIVADLTITTAEILLLAVGNRQQALGLHMDIVWLFRCIERCEMKNICVAMMYAACIEIASATSAFVPPDYESCVTVSDCGMMEESFSSSSVSIRTSLCGEFNSYCYASEMDVLESVFKSTARGSYIVIR